MTAKKATAAELREATIQMHCDSGGCDSVRGGPPGSHDSVGCHLAGMLDDILAAARAEAVVPVMDVLRALIEGRPQCEGNCDAPATKQRWGDAQYLCDLHEDHYGDDDYTRDMGDADAVRAALALLAAGEKAGK